MGESLCALSLRFLQNSSGEEESSLKGLLDFQFGNTWPDSA